MAQLTSLEGKLDEGAGLARVSMIMLEASLLLATQEHAMGSG